MAAGNGVEKDLRMTGEAERGSKTDIRAECPGARRHIHSFNAQSKSVPCKNRIKNKQKIKFIFIYIIPLK